MPNGLGKILGNDDKIVGFRLKITPRIADRHVDGQPIENKSGFDMKDKCLEPHLP